MKPLEAPGSLICLKIDHQGGIHQLRVQFLVQFLQFDRPIMKWYNISSQPYSTEDPKVQDSFKNIASSQFLSSLSISTPVKQYAQWENTSSEHTPKKDKNRLSISGNPQFQFRWNEQDIQFGGVYTKILNMILATRKQMFWV